MLQSSLCYSISKIRTSRLTPHGGVPEDVLSDVLSERPLQEQVLVAEQETVDQMLHFVHADTFRLLSY